MKVIIADFAGACYGVRRALDMALGATADNAVAYTLGPLIHNPRVVNQLAKRGVYEAASINEIDNESTVIIRSHGVTPDTIRAVEKHGNPIIDATCPHVARAQAAAAELAQKHDCVVVVGEAGHPEVEGLVARAQEGDADVVTVTSPEEVPHMPSSSVGVVVQTTQSNATLNAILGALDSQGIVPEVKNTICSATRLRQEAAASLAKEADAIVIIGGRNSSNTTRLAEICSECCASAYHVESVDELSPELFKGCSTVGVTAGASTPEDQIAAVISYLERM